MSRDEITAMALEANPENDINSMLPFLQRFAALVAAREREACAQVCESEWATDTEHAFGNELAALIRARSKP